MKVLLIHPDNDFDTEHPLPRHAASLQQDLGLDTVITAMAGDDKFIATIATSVLLNGPGTDASSLRYRQAAVRDAVAHPETVRKMYAIASTTLEERRKSFWTFLSEHPTSVLYSALQLLNLFMDRLRTLRKIAEAQAAAFESPAFRNLFAMLQRELDDAYLARVHAHLEELRFVDGALLSAHLGPGCEGEGYTLRRPLNPHPNWLRRLVAEHIPSPYTVHVAPRDMAGGKTLEAMRERGIHDVAEAVNESAAHIEGFFKTLHVELAFHVGCANLHEYLDAQHVVTCFPTIAPSGSGFRTRELTDIALALTIKAPVVGNDVDALDKKLIVVTGANQGGKSTLLRSLGLAQLMLHAGMFVTAREFESPLCTGVFTHYKREEDETMQGGKLDEELARLSIITSVIRPGAWLLCNESFASTNEREGAELARQMVDAMLERGIRVVFVTHLYAFAHGKYERHRADTRFLRAERLPDGTRSFRLIEGVPRETSYGEDLYREVFGADESPSATGANAQQGVGTTKQRA